MTDSAIKYVGVDGCKEGWIGIGLSDGDGWDFKVCGEFPDLLACFGDACVILVDIPIGLPEDGKPKLRDCDMDARWLLGEERGNSVFPVPSRQFVNEVMRSGWKYPDYAKANKWSKDRYGAGISVQSFGITQKIGEVDKALPLLDESVSSKIREAHPEVCFSLLNGKPMSHKKRERPGFEERLGTLRRYVPHVDDTLKEVRSQHKAKDVGRDDVLDALALAVTAKIGSQNAGELRSIPKDLSRIEFLRLPDRNSTPTDCKNLPMEMVYALPSDEGTPC